MVSADRDRGFSCDARLTAHVGREAAVACTKMPGPPAVGMLTHGTQADRAGGQGRRTGQADREDDAMATSGVRDLAIGWPGDADYERATRVFNLAGPVRPAAATTVRTVAQVRQAVDHARRTGMPVRVISTGHASATEAPMTGALLVRTELTGEVQVEPGRRIARIPAGTRWRDVVAATAPHGLTAPHGSSGTVGAVGYLLRGGISCYGRALGLASNSVRAVELVTADGSVRRCDARTDPELLWALRGGGGGFGVVTAVEVALYPVTRVLTGATIWDGAAADRLLAAWLAWSRTAPPAVTTSVRLLNLPSVPEVPEILRDRSAFCVDGVEILEPDADPSAGALITRELLGPLRALAEPVLDGWQEAGPAGVLDAHMDPEDPVPAQGDHLLLRDLDDRGAAEFLRLTGPDSRTPLVFAGLRQLGGALATPDPTGGALSHLDAGLLYSASGIPADESARAAITARLADLRSALAPWDTGRTAPTFVESPDQPQRHLDPVGTAAVDRVRARVDPHGLFATDIMPNATATRRAA
jgi:FAD binding domain